MRDRRIYLLDPKSLSPETIAVAFAKTSRSPKPFDAIAAELTDAKSAAFHEKWVVGYGHASVAEHAVLHIALENVSRLAIENVEGNRLASYTEKSTRYQQWDADAFFLPEELSGHHLEKRFIETCRLLFKTYQICIEEVNAYFRHAFSPDEGESEKAFERRMTTDSIDVCRFLLPAASLANVGVTMNARSLEYAICKMLSSPLREVCQIGEELRKVAKLETPTLIKYAACNEYLVSTRDKMRSFSKEIRVENDWKWFSLVSYDPKGEEKILAALMLRFGYLQDFETCMAFIQQLDEKQKLNLVAEIMASRGVHDQPLRELEYAKMTFEVVMDQGAYFEFKRHRMMTQTVQPLSADLGFALPKAIVQSGVRHEYVKAMQSAAQLYTDIAEVNPDAASYIIANGFNRRVLFTMNLREAFNFVRLRSASNAHFSIRRVSHRIVESIRQIYPLFGGYLNDAVEENWRDIEGQYFSLTS